MGPAQSGTSGALTGGHGFVVWVLLALGKAGQRAALPQRQELILGHDPARGVGQRLQTRVVRRLGGGQRIWVGSGWQVDSGAGGVQGKSPPGPEGVVTPPGQMVL